MRFALLGDHPDGLDMAGALVDSRRHEVSACTAGLDEEVMRRLGLGFDDLREHNPRLVYAHGSGWGPTGPLQHKGGQDILAQAASGMMMSEARE